MEFVICFLRRIDTSIFFDVFTFRFQNLIFKLCTWNTKSKVSIKCYKRTHTHTNTNTHSEFPAGCKRSRTKKKNPVNINIQVKFNYFKKSSGYAITVHCHGSMKCIFHNFMLHCCLLRSLFSLELARTNFLIKWRVCVWKQTENCIYSVW
jgi:hypothetical protein